MQADLVEFAAGLVAVVLVAGGVDGAALFGSMQMGGPRCGFAAVKHAPLAGLWRGGRGRSPTTVIPSLRFRVQVELWHTIFPA